MLDSSLFERVTKDVNGKRSGLKHTEYPEFKDEMKASVREFNSFVSEIIEQYNNGTENYKLKTKGVNNNWQNSGYYNPYFWNKILLNDNDYDGVIIWFLFNIEGLRITIGTTSTLESINNNLATKINDDFKSAYTDRINGFEISLDNKYASYLYTQDEVNKDDFVLALNTIVPIYKNIFIKYKNEIFNRNSIKNNVPITPLQQEVLDLKIKNIILYGSPGVGKTHNTKKLISLIESGLSEKEIFETIKNNELNDVVDIDSMEDRVKFITFHQSFGYEDFIEGFRPNEEGKIKLEDGVFKNICDDAKINFIRSIKYKSTLEHEEKEEKLFELFIDEIENEIDKNEKYYINSTVYITNVEGDAFRYKGTNWKNSQRMKFDDIKLIYHWHGFSRKSIKNIPNISGLAKQHATYFSYLATKLLEFSENQNIEIDEIKKEEQKNYYLVIDEINRGNISKIFGELITLIEEDKRDIFEVTLPYSKKPFKIPSNLYIIGTMNSTDKSIALIDIALRRRFTFLKMEPNLELVNNIKAKNIMQQLNEKITETLGADYVLGHSYFMKIENDDDLDFVLEYKIIPLLEEYFYGDEQGLKSVMEIVKYDGDDDTE